MHQRVTRKKKRTRKAPLLALDLFSGCGGLSLGLRQAGFQVIGAIDVDELAVETYRANHKHVRVWRRNIRWLRPRLLMRELGLRPGQLDLLAGCPPCQGFSNIRTLNGSRVVDDPRNDLIRDFLRFVRALRPKAIMMENVPGLLNDARFAQFVKKLRAMGYKPKFKVLDTASFGVPQRRKRMILLAGRSNRLTFAKPARKKRTVGEAIGSLPRPGKSGDKLHDLPALRDPRIKKLIKQIPRNGGSRIDLGSGYQLPCHRRCDGFKDIYGRMSLNDVAPTITSGCINPSKGRFLHPRQDRAITLREAALLQTFSRRYKFSLRRGKYPIAEMIGNALPPQFIKRHAAQVRSYLERRSRRGKRRTSSARPSSRKTHSRSARSRR